MSNNANMSVSRQKLAQFSSRDPKQTSRYYHEVMSEATKAVRSAGEQRKSK